MNDAVTVDDVVIEGFQAARDFLLDLFGTTDVSEILGFVPVLNAVRFFDGQMMTTIASPIVLRMFDELDANPETSAGRAKVAPFSESIAIAIQDAYQMIMAQVQQQQQARAALAQGNPSLIQGLT